MKIELEGPAHLPHGRRASFQKCIIDALRESAETKSALEHTPDNHKKQREQGRQVGLLLIAEIKKKYPK